MKRIVSLFTILMMVVFSTQFVYAHDDDHEDKITPMTAAERALHQIERLASVRMIDKTFVKHLAKLSVTDNVEGDRYVIRMSQKADAEGAEKKLSLYYGYKREFLGFQIHDYVSLFSIPVVAVTPTYISEQAIHKIDHFIEEKMIDAAYAEKFEHLEVSEELLIDLGFELVLGYKVVVTQRKDDDHDDDGVPKHEHDAAAITLHFDAKGKFIKYEVS